MAEEQPKPAGKEKEEKVAGRIPSAKKRDLQSKRRKDHNSSFRASVRTAVNAFETAVSQGDKTVILQRLSTVFSLMDKGVKTNKFGLNKAARTKSRLTQKVPR